MGVCEGTREDDRSGKEAMDRLVEGHVVEAIEKRTLQRRDAAVGLRRSGPREERITSWRKLYAEVRRGAVSEGGACPLEEGGGCRSDHSL